MDLRDLSEAMRVPPGRHLIDRRAMMAQTLAGGAAVIANGARAQGVDLHLPGGGGARATTTAFPGKGEMILQRIRPPLLETPMAVFDACVFTPNDRFFVRWHWADIPTRIDVEQYRLNLFGHVERPLSISLAALLRLPRVEIAAVNQCSGNSRGLFVPRVAGAQWGHGAMGNARWQGVRLCDLLDRAGVRGGAVAVRFAGLDGALVPGAPGFAKTLSLDHARSREVMVAFAMNGEALPMLNGFPLRLVVPGWYSTYWLKALRSIEVLDRPDPGYWMAKAYRIPADPMASVRPGDKDFATVPINRMVPRSWVTSLEEGQRVAADPVIPVGGIAMGGDRGVAKVDVSVDGGRRWLATRLGADHGPFSFRRWDANVPVSRGRVTIMSRCWNTAGLRQPMAAVWNPGGYRRAQVETTSIVVG